MTDAQWETLSNQGVAAAGVVYFLALLAYAVQWAALRDVPVRQAVAAGGGAPVLDVEDDRTSERVEMTGRLGVLLTAVGALAHLVALVGRGMAADPNRVPWGNMYEFTLSGTFVVVALFLATTSRWRLSWLGPIVVGFVLCVLLADVLWLYEPVAPLTEALESYWLVIHVVAAVIATGAFTLGGITSILYLLKARSTKETGYLARLPELPDLDRIAYRMHAFGFPVWTFGVLISGPIWAHQAWSSYWNWDPKEVWAFITWVVYAAYLHARATAGWRGRNAALLALVGAATLWFNFIGINFFSTTSQHSYAESAAQERSVVLRVAASPVDVAQEVRVVVGADHPRA
ncbi:c-type cytochrome biogenesis protein CcsB [Microbacterium sp. ARD31]|uniref:c-type cytochrome biogenesis protein CcsB n=1 Tax=Microbacterium sp. ARD31 TaxID=2962576 RepID=UPI002880C18E|nr:c-type cytochrome biogenesis protein CcsB [Microbacterium sp. ARD31]MDT0183586.1 c-type cytochrome biogenesis protein CcsB [Microbacterium sp. ARD31]